ncbi:c-type cytochrome [Phenylobacterium immobile]|uniref:c-type cytochrome n=1 Tax=Phenylobacterium immobile TaxID=21 RepID=UPI001C4005CA|nr:cytochrome c [Phenylobacterium immobile]
MRHVVGRLALVLLAASLGGAGSKQQLAPIARRPDPFIAETSPGQQFAKKNCGGCHNVTADDGPPDIGPPFTSLAGLDSEALINRFDHIAAHGLGAMPSIAISPQQARDLVIYLRGLPARRRSVHYFDHE